MYFTAQAIFKGFLRGEQLRRPDLAHYHHVHITLRAFRAFGHGPENECLRNAVGKRLQCAGHDIAKPERLATDACELRIDGVPGVGPEASPLAVLDLLNNAGVQKRLDELLGAAVPGAASLEQLRQGPVLLGPQQKHGQEPLLALSEQKSKRMHFYLSLVKSYLNLVTFRPNQSRLVLPIFGNILPEFGNLLQPRAAERRPIID